jgi:hypothetical protein
MLSFNECKKILNKTGNKYTDDEIEILRQLIFQFAQMDYNTFKKQIDGQQSGSLHQSFNN